MQQVDESHDGWMQLPSWEVGGRRELRFNLRHRQPNRSQAQAQQPIWGSSFQGITMILFQSIRLPIHKLDVDNAPFFSLGLAYGH